MNNIDWFFRYLEVHDVEATKVRVGRQHDGGYVVLDELCRTTQLVHSYGIGDDVSFEEDFADKYGGHIYCFDPTIETLPSTNSSLTFTKTGLGHGPGYHSLAHNLQQFGKTVRGDKMLKIDVDYHEWDALCEPGTYNYLLEFTQVIIELHIIPCISQTPVIAYTGGLGKVSSYFEKFYSNFDTHVNNMLFGHYTRAISNLLRDFVVFHVHGNNSLPKAKVGDYAWPQLLELSLVRRDAVKDLGPTTQSFPIPGLDFNNKSNRIPLIGPTLPFRTC